MVAGCLACSTSKTVLRLKLRKSAEYATNSRNRVELSASHADFAFGFPHEDD